MLADAGFGDWHVISAPGRTKGHAGVAVLTRQPPLRTSTDIGTVEFTDAGRWVEVDVRGPAGPVTVISTYVHTGEARTPRQDEKPALPRRGRLAARGPHGGRRVCRPHR